MCDIFVQGIAINQRKKIYNAVYRREIEKIKRDSEGLHEYKWRLDHMWIDLQGREEKPQKREREELTCPNCEVKRMRVQTRLVKPF